ncbi:hypothetical protein CEK60_03210 [Halomonas sp. N3-2A]|nr:hypothetical protein CEK60_03210 [Halomonas sp. N3-2A]
MSDRSISRQAVRELVKKNHEELIEAVNRGENAHQFSLDQQDILVEQHTAGMTIEEQARFFEMYAQESDALTAEVEANTQKIIQDTEKRNQNADNIGKAIGGFIIFLITIFVLFKVL